MSTPSPATNISGDDTGDAKIPKPSPFKRELKYGPSTSKKKAKVTKAKLRIIHVKVNVNDEDPSAGTHGFIITCDGYAERLMLAPMYDRNNADYQQFLVTLNPIGRVFTLLNVDGTTMTNSNGYQMRGLGFLIPRENVEETDETVLRNFVNDTFIPSLRMLPDVLPDRVPELDDSAAGYTEVQCWRHTTNDNDIRTFITVELRGDNHRNAGEWIRASQENLYSMYMSGTITANIRLRYALAANHMKRVDALALGLIQPNDKNDGNNDEDNN